jgi:CheY-like chemotaxis protein
MDGLTATREIRAWERANRRPQTPIIALTASALKGDREQFLAVGCTEFLTKPIKRDLLLQTIRDVCGVAPPSVAPARIRDHGVVVPPSAALAARVPVFLENRRKDVASMRDALALGDLKTVERLGHSMRSTGASYGFQGITDIGTDLEREAGIADVETSRLLVEELSTYLDHVALGTS